MVLPLSDFYHPHDSTREVTSPLKETAQTNLQRTSSRAFGSEAQKSTSAYAQPTKENSDPLHLDPAQHPKGREFTGSHAGVQSHRQLKESDKPIRFVFPQEGAHPHANQLIPYTQTTLPCKQPDLIHAQRKDRREPSMQPKQGENNQPKERGRHPGRKPVSNGTPMARSYWYGPSPECAAPWLCVGPPHYAMAPQYATPPKDVTPQYTTAPQLAAPPPASPQHAAPAPKVECQSDAGDLPADYSRTSLAFNNHQEAFNACKKDVASLKTAFAPPNDDPSIPKNDEERKVVVRCLLGAMIDTSRCKDEEGKAFKLRWGSGELAYDVRHMEKICWDIEVSPPFPQSYQF